MRKKKIVTDINEQDVIFVPNAEDVFGDLDFIGVGLDNIVEQKGLIIQFLKF